MGELSSLPNIGPDTERQLIQAGIHTVEQLRAAGSRQAWLDIKALDPSACFNRLCGLEGAVRGIPKRSLPDEVRRDLKSFYSQFR